MTVEELIEELKKCPSNLEVGITYELDQACPIESVYVRMVLNEDTQEKELMALLE
jgi:hypothetical protein